MNMQTRQYRLGAPLRWLTAGWSAWVLGSAVLAGPLPAPLTRADFYDHGRPLREKVELGRMLFFDKELSGNRNISCATCHHPFMGSSDGLSLGIGEGGLGIGPARTLGGGGDAVVERVPRNAPALFNLGARRHRVMFHDGRVEVDPNSPTGFRSPAGETLPSGLDNVLAVQAMFPVTSATEMAGQPGENEIADAAAAGQLVGPGGVWDLLASRLQSIPEYVEMFRGAFSSITAAGDITYVHAANAIAAYENVIGQSYNSPFDRHLRGAKGAMSREAIAGMRVFYGKGKCSTCHAGVLQTDHRFHSISLPQIGPGKGDGPDGHDDFGREQVTGKPDDRYRFRTPSLRNVALTGPWGHDGAYDRLEIMVLHHLMPDWTIAQYDQSQAVLPSREDLDEQDWVVFHDLERRRALLASSDLPPISLQLREFLAVIDFLHALTDPSTAGLRREVPRAVPSGLPVFD